MKNLFGLLLLCSLGATGYFFYQKHHYNELLLSSPDYISKDDTRFKDSCISQLKGHIAAGHIHHTSAMKTMFYDFPGNIMPKPHVESCKAVDQYGVLNKQGNAELKATLFRCSTHMDSYASRPVSFVGCFSKGDQVAGVKVYFDRGWYAADIKPGWKMGKPAKGIGLEFLPTNSTFGVYDDALRDGARSDTAIERFRKLARQIYGSTKGFDKHQLDARNQQLRLGKKYRAYESDLNKFYFISGILFILYLIAAARSRKEEVAESHHLLDR